MLSCLACFTIGKLERWHKTLKGQAIRPLSLFTLAQTRRIVANFVTDYNEMRVHSAISYVTPQARLTGQDHLIRAERNCKLALARQRRQQHDHLAPALSQFNSSVQLVISEPEISISR